MTTPYRRWKDPRVWVSAAAALLALQTMPHGPWYREIGAILLAGLSCEGLVLARADDARWHWPSAVLLVAAVMVIPAGPWYRQAGALALAGLSGVIDPVWWRRPPTCPVGNGQEDRDVQ